MQIFENQNLTKARQLLLENKVEESLMVFESIESELTALDKLLYKGNYYLVAQNFKESVTALIQAKQLAVEQNEISKLLIAYELLTTLYYKIADYSSAAENCLEYIELLQDTNQSKTKLFDAFLQLGNIYQSTHNFQEAISNYTRANKLAKQLKNTKQDSETLFKIGNAYNWNEELELAENFLLQNISINKNEGYYNAWSLASLSILYTKQKKYSEAQSTFEKSLSEAKQANDTQLISNIYKSLGNLFLVTNRFDQAIETLSKSIDICKQLNLKVVLMKAHEFIAEAYEKKGDLASAYHNFKAYYILNEEIKQTDTDIKLKGLQLKFDVDEAKNEAELYRLKNIDLVTANNEIERQKQEIVLKNQEITDSIVYARRIQNSILPETSAIQTISQEHFVLYKPKDIVSGDFYWISENEEKVYFAVIDCTGHGVPGAFLSIIVNNLFNKAIHEQNLVETQKILEYIHQELIVSLNKKNNDSGKDGMDVALCSIDKKTRELQYSGANNPLIIVRNGQLIELKPDKMMIGNNLVYTDKQISLNSINLFKNDMLYLYSDGYADQFGGPKGKKFKSKRLKSLFLEIFEKSCVKQLQELENTFVEWKSNLEQIDDVCIMGIKI
ncbi:MAG: tetratricopeptide repeat protein [Flavobacteriales bacterium]|nr:tetratricopeptide repeat protein [Flavobacteriales bacterium]